MIKLYCFPRSGNSREVKIVLAEKGLAFTPIDIKADPAAKDSPEFKKASPKGTVPALVDGDVHLSEAYLINEYLDKAYPEPPLLPASEAERAAIKAFILGIDKKVILNIGLLVIECILKPKPEQREDFKEKKRAEVLEGLRELDRMLEGREYLFGPYTIADASVTPHLAALPILGMGIPAELAHLTAWYRRVQARPSFQRSLL